MKFPQQKIRDKHIMKKLALELLAWHGGQSSGLYSVGSTMLACANSNAEFDPKSEVMQTSLRRAISELRNLRRDANRPECVSDKDERACNNLAWKLETLLLS
jgi:hypothetical protein